MQTRTWTLALTSAASLMVSLDVLAVTTALSEIRNDLDTSLEALEWTVTAYNLTFAVFIMTATALGDRFGRRRVFAAGLGLFVVASAACALAPSAGWLIAARSVQGLGASAVSPLAFALISGAYPAERRGRALGIAGSVAGLAVVGGPVAGGILTEAVGWEWIFWLNVPIGLLVIPLLFARTRESRRQDAAIDLRGVALATAAAFGLVWGLVRAGSHGWLDAATIVGTATGVALTVAFVAWQRRAPHPLLPLRFFRLRGFTVGNVITVCHGAMIMGPVFLMAQFLQTAMGYGPFEAGLRLIPWTGTLLAVAPIAGALADRYGQRRVMQAGLGLAAFGMVWVIAIAKPGVSYGELVLPLVIWGVGNSAVFPAVQSAVVGAVSADGVGKASGVNQMLRGIGGTLGIALAAAIFASVGGYDSAQQFTDGFRAAIGVCATVGLLAVFAAAHLPSAVRHTSPLAAAPTRLAVTPTSEK